MLLNVVMKESVLFVYIGARAGAALSHKKQTGGQAGRQIRVAVSFNAPWDLL